MTGGVFEYEEGQEGAAGRAGGDGIAPRRVDHQQTTTTAAAATTSK
jgi:hypothetical protein